MRGADITQEELFSYRTLEDRIPDGDPIRKLRKVVDLLLKSMDKEFEPLYARTVRKSIPPERLLRASLLKCSSASALRDNLFSRSSSICCAAG